jgi:hypothetical protein
LANSCPTHGSPRILTRDAGWLRNGSQSHSKTFIAWLISNGHERIATACGVGLVRSAGPDDLEDRLPSLFREALAFRGLALLVIRTRCDPEPA